MRERTKDVAIDLGLVAIIVLTTLLVAWTLAHAPPRF